LEGGDKNGIWIGRAMTNRNGSENETDLARGRGVRLWEEM